MKDYTQHVRIKSSSKNAFEALTREIPNWWGSVDHSIQGINEDFTITFGNAYWTFKIVDYRPNQLLIWKCIDGQPELNNEWIGHMLKWTIEEDANATMVSLIQEGLNESLPCYDVCSAAWDRFILVSLKAYLEKGTGQPGS